MANGIFVGLSTVDVIFHVDQFPSGNSKIVAHTQDVFAGGPASNACVTFAHLGGKATLVTTLGRHPLAGVVREELKKYSTRVVDLNSSFDEAPALSSIAVDRTGQRNIVSVNGTRIKTLPAQIDESILDGASVLLVDGHYMEACQAWAKRAHARGAPVVFDGGSWKEGTEDLLESVDTAICSADFLPPGCSSEDDVLRYLQDRAVKHIAITNGAGPVRFVSGSASGCLRVRQIEAVDTMGAGDILHGAFCYYASQGHGFMQALGEATEIASESCRFHGTREWMKHATA